MNKCLIVSKIFDVLAIIGFILYLITKYSYFMFIGGLSLIIASILLIISKKDKNE